MKKKFIKEILSGYSKLCYDRGAIEDQGYKNGLEIGAEIMYNKMEQQIKLEALAK